MYPSILRSVPSHIEGFTSFVDNDQLIWSVICHKCDVNIGLMSEDTLLKAILLTRHRGGVLCPKCRQRYCEVHGGLASQGQVLHTVRSDIAGSNGWLTRVCELCLRETPDVKPIVDEYRLSV